jgi:hypothetical protein
VSFTREILETSELGRRLEINADFQQSGKRSSTSIDLSAPRPMKMGTSVSAWRYDGMRHGKRRNPVSRAKPPGRYDSLANISKLRYKDSWLGG